MFYGKVCRNALEYLRSVDANRALLKQGRDKTRANKGGTGSYPCNGNRNKGVNVPSLPPFDHRKLRQSARVSWTDLPLSETLVDEASVKVT